MTPSAIQSGCQIIVCKPKSLTFKNTGFRLQHVSIENSFGNHPQNRAARDRYALFRTLQSTIQSIAGNVNISFRHVYFFHQIVLQFCLMITAGQLGLGVNPLIEHAEIPVSMQVSLLALRFLY